MKVERINYSVSGLSCRGALVFDEASQAKRPLLLMAPNWLGITPTALEVARMLAGDRYVVFVADMYGEGNGPKGTENPMEFLAQLMPVLGTLAEQPQQGVPDAHRRTLMDSILSMLSMKRPLSRGRAPGGPIEKADRRAN